MAITTGYDTYRSSHFEGMDPKRLILMLYEGALKHIGLAKEGILEKNSQKRGENLSKTIAIVSELNASLDPGVKDEAIEFLRGLYEAILSELPRVSLNNDVKILDRSASYISALKEIWVNHVIGASGKEEAGRTQPAAETASPPAQAQTVHRKPVSGINVYDRTLKMGIKSFSV